MRLTLLITLALTGCAPDFIHTGMSPEHQAAYLSVAPRLLEATGVELWNPELAPCVPGPGCAYSVPEFSGEPRVVGRGNPFTGEARIRDDLDDAPARQVALHEILHTIGVLHVTSETVMNPVARKGYDCISQAELTQLCAQYRCKHAMPECDAGDGWGILVPERYIHPGSDSDDEVEVTPEQYLTAAYGAKMGLGLLRKALQ